MPETSSSFLEIDAALPDAPVSRADRRDLQIGRILDAAKACFVKSGFQGASMHQVCAEAGMSPGALYRYFPSKEAIIEAIAESHRKHDAEIFAAMFENPDVIDGFVTAAMAHIRHMHESGNAALFAEIRAESMRNPSVDIACRDAMCSVDEAFRDYLQAAIDRREIAPCVGLDALIPMIAAIGEGLAINDLPRQGVSFENIETLLRETSAAMLRPLNTSSQTDAHDDTARKPAPAMSLPYVSGDRS